MILLWWLILNTVSGPMIFGSSYPDQVACVKARDNWTAQRTGILYTAWCWDDGRP